MSLPNHDLHPRVITLNGTPTLRRFVDEHVRFGEFLSFLLILAYQTDENRKVAIRALAKIRRDGLSSDAELAAKLEEADRNGAISTLSKFFGLTLEMYLCRATDNYLCYLTSLLSMVFRTIPNTLRSNEQIRIDRILHLESMEQVIAFIADKKVNELAYQSMADLRTYFKDKLGLDLFDSVEEEKMIVKIILIRNLIVHNRGIVNERFASSIPEYAESLNTGLKLEKHQVLAMIIALFENVRSIDERAIEKFNLKEIEDLKCIDPFYELTRPSPS